MADLFTAPWYPWYVTDVLTSERVELMSLAEEGAYRRALDRAWKKGSIPADPVQCARAIGKRCPVGVAKTVLQMFQPMSGDPTRMVNDTLEKVREEQRQKYLSTSRKGKAGAEKRWHSHSPAITQAMPKQWQSESDTDTEDKKEKKKKAPPPTDQEWLDSLAQNPAYKNIPVLIEFEKAKVWATTNNRQCTRKFFVGWLNRARPMDLPSNGSKPDPGRHKDAPAQVRCKKCLDTGEVTQKPRNAKYDWEIESVPCDCKVKVAA